MSFSLKVDYRENRGADVISAISALRSKSAIVAPEKYDIVVEGLTVGDFIIYYGQYVLVIERKTLSDLASSISDRRIYRNHEKLLGVQADMPDFTVRVMYMIEGERNTPNDTKFSGIAFSSLISKLDHLSMMDGCLIDWTQNCAVRLLELGKNILTIKGISAPLTSPTIEGGGTVEDLVNKSVKKSFVKPIADVQMSMMRCVKLVGKKTAERLLAVNKFADIISGSSDLSCVSLKIGNEIHAFCAGERPACVRAMLLEIKGVSGKVADIILSNTTVKKLATDLTVNDLALFKSATGRKIGNALSIRIIEIIRS